MSEDEFVRNVEGGGDWADSYAGAGPVDTIAQTIDGITKIDGPDDFFEAGLNLGAVGLDALGFLANPLDTLATSVIGWVLEHISFLRDALDVLTGNPDEIKLAVQSFHGAADLLDQAAADHDRRFRTEVPTFVGGGSASAAKFGAAMKVRGEQLKAGSMACMGAAEAVTKAGVWIATVRGLIRDLTATYVWELLQSAMRMLVAAPLTFGGAAALWLVDTVAKATAKFTQFARIIADLAGKLMDLCRLMGVLGQRIAAAFDAVGKGVARAGGKLRQAGEKIGDNGFYSPTRTTIKSGYVVPNIDGTLIKTGADLAREHAKSDNSVELPDSADGTAKDSQEERVRRLQEEKRDLDSRDSDQEVQRRKGLPIPVKDDNWWTYRGDLFSPGQ